MSGRGRQGVFQGMQSYEPGNLALLSTELQWQRVIQDAAGYLGYLTYHTYFSKRSEKGFPDLVCCGKNRVVFIECKKQKGGRVSLDQAIWLTELRTNGQLAILARPSDWELVYHALTADVVILPEHREKVKGYGEMVLPELIWRGREGWSVTP